MITNVNEFKENIDPDKFEEVTNELMDNFIRGLLSEYKKMGYGDYLYDINEFIRTNNIGNKYEQNKQTNNH